MLQKKAKFKHGDAIRITSVTDDNYKKLIGKCARIINYHYYEESNNYSLEIEYDSESLRSYNEFDFKQIIKQELSPFYNYIPEESAELIEPRDTIEQLEKTQNIIDLKILKLQRAKIDRNDFRYYTDIWLRNFLHSKYYRELTYEQKCISEFIIDVFSEQMSEYENKLPEQWDAESLENVCTISMPQKTTTDKETVDSIVPVLYNFFQYLQEEEILETKELQKKLKSLEEKIINSFSDKDKWGPAKAFAMSMIEKGIDFSDQNAVNKYMEEYNKKMIK